MCSVVIEVRLLLRWDVFNDLDDQIVKLKVLHMLLKQYILYEFNLFYSVNM
jgi:hypothetical protein